MSIRFPLTVVFILAASVHAEEKQADIKKLQGKWVATKQQFDGKEQPESEWVQKAWEFNDKRASITLKGLGGKADSVLTFDLEIDNSKQPAEMDLKARNPKFGFIAIYKFDGENLIVCWNAGRETRPSKFETSKADTQTLITFKRAK